MINKKVILDVDPGIDDAVAMAIALFDPHLEVVATTACGGSVLPDQATRNVQAIIEQLDPPRLPRIGVASLPDDGLPATNCHLYGSDGLGDAQFQIAELHQRHPADKVIFDEVRASPEQITIIALGPLTNVARALLRDPQAAEFIGQIVIMGGTLCGPGNVTPAAEFNIYSDPASARAVVRSATTKTLVPVDVANELVLTYDFLGQIPDESNRVGRLLRKIMPCAFRSYRQELGLEGIYLHAVVTLAAALRPELFESEMTAADVELSGELTTGATVFDRRRNREWRPNMAVVASFDVAAVADFIHRGLATAATASQDAGGPGTASR